MGIIHLNLFYLKKLIIALLNYLMPITIQLFIFYQLEKYQINFILLFITCLINLINNKAFTSTTIIILSLIIILIIILTILSSIKVADLAVKITNFTLLGVFLLYIYLFIYIFFFYY